MKKLGLFSSVALVTLSLVGCNKPNKAYLASWNDCSALTALKEYVEDVTNKNSKNYIPVEDRIATFDMDGTFVGELYPSYFEYNILEYRGLDDPTYVEKDPYVVETAQDIRDFVRTGKALPHYDEEYGFDIKHAVAAAKAYSGMTIKEFDEYVKSYASKPANGFSNMTYGESFYKPMLEVFEYLKANDFTYYVVSGSDRFICRSLVESIGIPSNRVIGMDVELKSNKQGDTAGVNYTMGVDEYLVRTDNLLIKNLKTNKVKQITQEIGKVPVLSFGNSGGDSAMHNYCLSNKQYRSEAFMLVADDDERDHAKKYGEDDAAFNARIAKLNSDWTAAKYHVISMKNDFKTIYGENVVKTDFVF
ncbi:MAG: haloacid dehalogenase-like hydrolase [Bacilli bacterium]|nr:haloacid dehalogenase-like hydrolase [Bacilli bacterium]MBO4682612.1 haloacid dehalogenase-like hydrolase [Bacilli bacterium]